MKLTRERLEEIKATIEASRSITIPVNEYYQAIEALIAHAEATVDQIECATELKSSAPSREEIAMRIFASNPHFGIVWAIEQTDRFIRELREESTVKKSEFDTLELAVDIIIGEIQKNQIEKPPFGREENCGIDRGLRQAKSAILKRQDELAELQKGKA